MRTVFSAPDRLTGAELSPDGERVVYARQGLDGPRLEGPPQIYLLDADGTEERLTDLPGGASDPTWSPDGRRIAFTGGQSEDADADIFTIGADGRHLTRLVGTPANDGAPDWSPDGSRIAFQARRESGHGGIWVVDTRTGLLSRLTPSSIRGAMDPAWSPDGRWLAYSRYHPGYTGNGRLLGAELSIIRRDGTAGRTLEMPGRDRVNENPSWSPDGQQIVFEQHDWNWISNRVLTLDPWTGLVRPVLSPDEADIPTPALGAMEAFADAAPSWTRFDGIIMTLPNWNPDPTPSMAPPLFQAEGFRRIAATITMHRRRGCDLEVEDPIRPGVLMVELVNDSPLDGYFRILRLDRPRPRPQVPSGRPWGAAASFSKVQAHPTSYYYGRGTVYVDPSGTTVWSSRSWISSGAWAVVCSQDRIHTPKRSPIVPVGVAGPIEVRR